MSQVLLRLLVVVVILALVVGIASSLALLAGMSVASLISYWQPGIDAGSALVAGMIAASLAFYALGQIIRGLTLINVTSQSMVQEGDEDDDLDNLSEEDVDAIADRVSEALMEKMQSIAQYRSPKQRNRR